VIKDAVMSAWSVCQCQYSIMLAPRAIGARTTTETLGTLPADSLDGQTHDRLLAELRNWRADRVTPGGPAQTIRCGHHLL
jgi:hypothetical protein